MLEEQIAGVLKGVGERGQPGVDGRIRAHVAVVENVSCQEMCNRGKGTEFKKSCHGLRVGDSLGEAHRGGGKVCCSRLEVGGAEGEGADGLAEEAYTLCKLRCLPTEQGKSVLEAV